MYGVAGSYGANAVAVMRRHAHCALTDDPLSLVQSLDMKIVRPVDIPTTVDQARLAHSLEVRAPLLEHPLVELISSLPPGLRLRGGRGKSLFKREVAA